MASYVYSDQSPLVTESPTRNPTRRERFNIRFPDFAKWLDGQVWAIPVTEIGEAGMGIAGFRATLHYQAKTLGLQVETKTARDDGTLVFLVRAY